MLATEVKDFKTTKNWSNAISNISIGESVITSDKSLSYEYANEKEIEMKN